MAVVLAAGTSVAVGRCLRGEIERASAVLVATWALMLTAAGAWLLPAAEPYRLSGIVGRHLAALCGEREGAARSWPRSSPRASSTRWGVPPP